jgi:hypothetical protein
MFSRKLTKSIGVGVAAIAVAGGSYGIVSATSSGASAAATSSSPAAGGGSGGGDPTLGPDRPQGDHPAR